MADSGDLISRALDSFLELGIRQPGEPCPGRRSTLPPPLTHSLGSSLPNCQADLFFALKTEQFSLTSWLRDFVSWRSRSFATVSVTDATIFAIPDKKSWLVILFYSQEASTYHRPQDQSPPGHQLCLLLFARCSSFLLRGFGSWQIECAHGKQTLTCVTF